MKNNLAEFLKQAYVRGYKEGYDAAYLNASDIAVKTAHMAFCVSMNKELQIGQDRLEKVENKVLHYLTGEFIKDSELTFARFQREYQRLTGKSIDEVYELKTKRS